ncbi:acyl-homoserine-lactone acylase [Pseudoduganella flava]|uniref:Acyl-homoserine-lactone acylase n=1 Tax=Pseudoduganella flava TaxID=871742 RepID=A0A562PWI2_9BURK|nr:penicillin acylase family protein [Pseudoduganella flava]TWI48811.1 acyl-homoserine-lactone acylase [Pseudoduganella flava]
MTCTSNAAAACLLAALLTACGGNGINPPSGSRYQATIARTAYGIPHIEAADEAGLGFGIGYAYAQDNFCLLAAEILTVSGERSRWFGADGATSENLELAVNNLDSDFFFRQMNDDAAVLRAWNAQPAEVQALMRGYAAGVNRYVADKGIGTLPEACRNARGCAP